MLAFILRRAAIVVLLSAFAAPAIAQYPAKPVRMIVAFAPGTTSDIIGRMLAEKLTQQLHQPFVVENRTGAGGTIGAEAVAKSAPDGYTILVSTAALPVSAHVYPNLKYDTAKDFASITVISHSPLLLAANLNFPPKNVMELVQYAKANPGKVRFGSAGVGTSQHLAGELFKTMAGIEITHVPYRGIAAVMPDLLAGRNPMVFGNISPVRWCEVPTPAESKLTLPGLALAYWTSSITFFGGKFRFAARRSGECEITVMEAKSFAVSYLRLG